MAIRTMNDEEKASNQWDKVGHEEHDESTMPPLKFVERTTPV